MDITVAQSDSNIYWYSDYAGLESYNWFHRFLYNNINVDIYLRNK